MNDQNLIPISSRSPRERSEIGRKGAEVTNRIKKEKKTLKQELEALLEIIDKEDGKTYQEKISFAMIKKANDGDTKAYEVIRDTIGQKPKESMTVEIDKNKEEAKELLENIKQAVSERTDEEDS